MNSPLEVEWKNPWGSARGPQRWDDFWQQWRALIQVKYLVVGPNPSTWQEGNRPFILNFGPSDQKTLPTWIFVGNVWRTPVILRYKSQNMSLTPIETCVSPCNSWGLLELICISASEVFTWDQITSWDRFGTKNNEVFPPLVSDMGNFQRSSGRNRTQAPHFHLCNACDRDPPFNRDLVRLGHFSGWNFKLWVGWVGELVRWSFDT